MAEIPDVIGGEYILTSWGNPIRDRTVQRYVDETQRDTLLPVPVAGDLAYMQNADSFEIYDGAKWNEYYKSPDPVPWVPSSGGTFTGTVLVANPAGGANSILSVGEETGDASIRIFSGVWPTDGFQITTELDGDALKISSFAQNFLSFNRATNEIRSSAPLNFQNIAGIVGPTEINASTDAAFSIRMRNAAESLGWAITKATTGTLDFYSYDLGGPAMRLDPATKTIQALGGYTFKGVINP